MCTIESIQIMLNIIGLFSKLSIKRLDYIGMIETDGLKRIIPICDGPEYQQESIQLNDEFYEIQRQIFLQILRLIKIKDKDSFTIAVRYLSELIKSITLPNYKKISLDSSLNEDIQEAMDTAQKAGNYELRDKIIEYKAKTYKLNDLPANI